MAKRKAKSKGAGMNAPMVIAPILVILLIASIIGGAVGWIRAKAYGEQVKKLQEQISANPPDDDNSNIIIAYSGDGEPMYAGSSYELPTTMVYTSRALQEYLPTGEITVTACCTNQYIKGKYDWNVKFANESDEWAVGKSADTYVSVEPTEDGSDKAKIKLLENFGSIILIEASLRGSSGETDTCKINCIKDITLTGGELYSSDFDDEITFGTNVDFGTGTIEGVLHCDSFNINIDPSFTERVQGYLRFDIQFIPFEIHSNFNNLIDEDNKGQLFVEVTAPGVILSYTMFIKGFDEFDEEHKNAIYFAWRQAYKDIGYGNTNITISYSFSYLFKSNNICSCIETDIVGGYISGACYGEGVNPDTILNGNYVV